MERACELLTEAGIAFTKHVHVGQAAQVIAECADEMRSSLQALGSMNHATLDLES